jgi:HSP20 family protein
MVFPYSVIAKGAVRRTCSTSSVGSSIACSSTSSARRRADSTAAYVLRAELPGVSEKDIELSVTGNTLSLKAERKLEAPQGHSAHRTERSGWTLARSLELPVQVDSSAVVAELKHGILTVTLPKSKEALPKQISVKVS